MQLPYASLLPPDSRPYKILQALAPGRGIDLAGASCELFHQRFPKAQMRAEYTGSDRLVRCLWGSSACPICAPAACSTLPGPRSSSHWGARLGFRRIGAKQGRRRRRARPAFTLAAGIPSQAPACSFLIWGFPKIGSYNPFKGTLTRVPLETVYQRP